MKKFNQILIATLISLGISQIALANTFVNKKVVEKTQSSTYLVTKFFVLGAKNKELFANDIYNAVIADRDYNSITLIYNDKKQLSHIKSIKEQLVKKGIKEKQIKFVEKKQAIYPLFAEVQYSKVSFVDRMCRYRIAEQRVIYRKYQPCAVNHNLAISLKR